MSAVRKILEKKGHHVYSIGEDATVLDAARTMNEHRIGALVITRGDTVVGIFTERDILCRVVAEKRDPFSVHVREVMSSPVACCTSQTTRAECRIVMRERRLRHLPVVDDGRLVGMISIGDLYEATEADQDRTIQDMYEYVLGGTEGR